MFEKQHREQRGWSRVNGVEDRIAADKVRDVRVPRRSESGLCCSLEGQGVAGLRWQVAGMT